MYLILLTFLSFSDDRISVPVHLMDINDIPAANIEQKCSTINKNYFIYYECSNPSIPADKCGYTCDGSDSSEFSYTFKGEKFAIYGRKYRASGLNIDLSYGNSIRGFKTENIDLNSNELQDRVQLYESPKLDYDEYTISVKGKQNGYFNIYKFEYWPYINAKKYDILTNHASYCTNASDLIGG